MEDILSRLSPGVRYIEHSKSSAYYYTRAAMVRHMAPIKSLPGATDAVPERRIGHFVADNLMPSKNESGSWIAVTVNYGKTMRLVIRNFHDPTKSKEFIEYRHDRAKENTQRPVSVETGQRENICRIGIRNRRSLAAASYRPKQWT